MDDLVTLDAYAEENRALIHNGRNDEAIAICKHILQFYPKHIDSYRQMGEAHLEKDELDPAVDLFRRVLSADPENVIAYAGLASVFEKQHLIEEAVWHLERADEIEPGNFEIHKELLRLYSEAGKPRQRLKLSPAGLARLYDQEGLYSQAIHELHSIVDATPSRYDARIALAETLWHAGRIRESAEIAQNILASLPYCLKANLILGTAWKESGLEDYTTYLDRAQELDPSNKMAIRLLATRSPLSGTQVSVPRYIPGATPPGTAQPSPAPATPAATEPPKMALEEATTSTDFVAEAPGVEQVAAVSPPLEPETAPTIKPNLPGANLPPWLVSQFPESSETASPTQAPSSADTVSQPETAATESTGEDLPTWLSGEDQTQPPSAPTREEVPETASDQLPNWLESPTAETGTALPAEAQPQAEEPHPAGDVPEWLRSLQTPNPQAADSEPAPTEESAAAEEYVLPSFLATETEGAKETEEPTAPDTHVPSGQEMEAASEARTEAGTPAAQPTPPTIETAPVAIDQAIEAKPAETTQKQLAEESTSAQPTLTTEEPAPVPMGQVEAQPVETAEKQPRVELTSAQPAPTTEEPAPVPMDQAVEARPVETAEKQPAEELTPARPTPVIEEPAPVPMDQVVETQPAETTEPASAPPSVVEVPTAVSAPSESAPAIAQVPSGAPAAAPAPTRKRRPKGSEHLVLARKHRDTGQTDNALVEYDYIVQHAPRLVNDVIADLELVTAQPDAPLEAHRILGDAYTRADRLTEALQRYQYVLGRTPSP